ncbi:MAG TPA: hypothetical protein VF737_13810 [Gemmatimonadaceae bacterium]
MLLAQEICCSDKTSGSAGSTIGIPQTRASADSVLDTRSLKFDTVAGKCRAGFEAPIGRALDLLGALEASWAAPTDVQQRTLRNVTEEVTADVNELNAFITQEMPALRAKPGAAGTADVVPVGPPLGGAPW